MAISKQIVFRTDASLEIGTGHVMRCLTLAAGLTEQGATVRFLCRDHDGNLIDLIEDCGFVVQVLHSAMELGSSLGSIDEPAHVAWLGSNWRSDAEQCRAVLPNPVDWIIVDHYGLDYQWESVMRDKCNHIMVIDDLADRTHDCDLLLDQSLGRTVEDYCPFVSLGTRMLLGPQYALLRPEFAQWRDASLARRQNPKLRHLLVTMGGVDRDNVTGSILSAIAQCRLAFLEKITVVLGPHAPWHVAVGDLAAEMQVPATIMSGVDNMAELMMSCDLAIGAGGATTWERCSLGVPTILINLAENQKFISQEVNRSGAVILCDVANLDCELEKILCLASEPSCMKALSASASKITDGRGMKATRQIIKEFLT